MSDYKISGIGLDTSNLSYIPHAISDENTSYDYYYTNISSNNGLVLRPLLDRSNNVTLAVGVDFLDHVSLAIREHLYELSRSTVNILFIDAGCKWYEYEDEIKSMLESGLVDELGIKNPEKLTVDELEVLRVKFNLKHIGINICPLYYWKDIMDWANMVGLKIYGFNPFGGHISAPSLIDAFTIPYLLNFSAMQSDVVILSGKDIVFSDVNRDYLTSLKGTDTDDSIYKMKKNVNKLLKPLKRVAFNSLSVNGELFPVSETDLIFNPEEFTINLGTAAIDIDKITEITEDDVVGQEILKYLEDAYLPKDAKNPKDFMAIIRPRAFSIFRSHHLEKDGWFNISAFIGDVFLFNAYRETRHKRWFSKDIVIPEVHTYLLYYTNGLGFVLRNLQNSDLESSES